MFEKVLVTSEIHDILPDESNLDIHRTWGLLDENTWAYEVSGTWNGIETFAKESSIVNHLLDAVRGDETFLILSEFIGLPELTEKEAECLEHLAIQTENKQIRRFEFFLDSALHDELIHALCLDDEIQGLVTQLQNRATSGKALYEQISTLIFSLKAVELNSSALEYISDYLDSHTWESIRLTQ
jgi:hypothetical protein